MRELEAKASGVLCLKVVLSRGLVNFDTAVAYHLCFNLPETFLQPRVHFLAKPAQQFTYTCFYELVEATNLYAHHITSFLLVVLNTWH